MNIAPLDWAVLVAYLVIITAIGLIVGWRVRQSGEYFLGGRRFGPWLMIGQSFSIGTHAEMPVALAGAVYSVGASAIWYQWKNLFITPFYWIMAPVFRRIRRTSMAEFTEDRYGSWMGAIYSVFALCFFIINTGSMLKGAGKVISQATGAGVGANQIVVAMTVMFILYSFVGGLVAAAWTDLFQGFLIIALSFMLIPLGWRVVGGLDGMHASLAPFRFSLATPSGIGPMVIAILAATMSACSAFLVDSGALFTEGLYRRRLVPNRPDRHYLWVGRISGFVITMLGVLYALFLIQSVLYTFLLTETLATFVGISVLGGIVCRRSNRSCALASLLSALATNFALYSVTGQRLDHWDANVFLAALVAGIVALVVVSLLTQAEPAESIDSLFGRLQTSSDDALATVADPSSRAVAAHPLLLVNLLHLGRAAA